MGIPTIQTALNAGEFSPDLFGRVDLDKYRKGASTMRNFFASYRGGAVSRAGTAFCGITKQGNKGQANNVPPPRNIAFQYSATQGIIIEMGQNYFRFLSNGAYVTEAATNIVNVTTENPCVITTGNSNGYSTGDEIFISSMGGILPLDGNSYEIVVLNSTQFYLINTLDGMPVDSSQFPAWTSGGLAARIYTLATPYAASDLALLKFAQSADVMSFTHPSYRPYDLTRIEANLWTLVATQFAPTIASPPTCTAAQVSSTSSLSFWYQLCATAVDASTGAESVASPVSYVLTCDQAVIAGSINIYCGSVDTAGSYNFYSGPVSYNTPQAQGSIFGYLGSSFGPSFTDTNVVPDYTISPPLHTNPFATSSITAVVMSNQGSGYSNTQTTATVTSPIGQNATLIPIIVNDDIVWTSVIGGGEGYTGGEAVVFTDASGGGSGAVGTIQIGPATGTWPGCVAYFQQRRFYANTTNNPDTYFASQPGEFTNMDSSLPVTDDDAIVGSPWSQQVNGIQWMINMPGGLVILTGLGAWQLSGGATGIATAAAVTPSNQVANPQAYNGVSPLVPPIVINYDILYVQERGSIVRNLSYNYFVNIYTGTDMTVLSNHLFNGYQILEWAWAEEPYKLVWCVRDDGILLCLTFLKEQDVYAWSRHDTNGLYQSVATVSEPPVNAPYFVVQRYIQNNGNPVWVYMQERMDDRLWNGLENSWCVDAGLFYQPNFPQATMTLTSASTPQYGSSGTPSLATPDLTYGGANYSSSTFAEITDPTGSGATLNLTIAGGVITAAGLSGNTIGYTDPTLTIIDPTGAGGGAVVDLPIQWLTFAQTNAPVFTGQPGFGAVGDVIRMNGRILTVVEYNGQSSLLVNVQRNTGTVISDDPNNTATPSLPGNWSITAPASKLYGLSHLEGMEVSILADGIVQTPQVVKNGAITLTSPATSIIAGLGFTAQLQTMYLEVPGGVTVQGRRKEIDQVIVRVAQSGAPFQIGTNQPDQSLQPNNQAVPWHNMTSITTPIDTNNPVQPFEFYNGDVFCGSVAAQLGEDEGQVAIQQSLPMPLTIVAIIPWTHVGDDPDVS